MPKGGNMSSLDVNIPDHIEFMYGEHPELINDFFGQRTLTTVVTQFKGRNGEILLETRVFQRGKNKKNGEPTYTVSPPKHTNTQE